MRITLGHTVMAAALAAAITGAACGGRDPSAAGGSNPAAQRSAVAAPRAPGYVVDSALPPEEALRRFREALPVSTRLAGGAATSRDHLVTRFVRAVAEQDTAALRAMSIDKAEFAYLYYPRTQYVRPPYLLAPDVVWQLMHARSESGMKRLVARVGGDDLKLQGYGCEAAPSVQGDIRLYQQCSIRYRRAGTEPIERRRLFGSIIERDGRYKFVSYANDF